MAGIEYKRNDGNPCNRAEKLNEESSSQLRQKELGALPIPLDRLAVTKEIDKISRK